MADTNHNFSSSYSQLPGIGKAAPKNSSLFSLTLVDEEGKIVDYGTLTCYRDKDVVEFSVLTNAGHAYVGSHKYEDEEHWEETLKILKRLPPITLLKDNTCKIKRIGVRLTQANLTDTQKLEFRVDALEREVQTLRLIASKQIQWTPIPQVVVGNFTFNTKEVVSFPIEVAPEATQVFVHVYLKSAKEIDAKVWTRGENGTEYYQLVKGTSTSQTGWFPLAEEERAIHVQSNSESANSEIQFQIIGYN